MLTIQQEVARRADSEWCMAKYRREFEVDELINS